MAQVLLITHDTGLRDALTALLWNRGHDVVTERCPVERALHVGWGAAFIDVSDGGVFGLALVGRMRAGQPMCRIAAIDWVRQATGRRRLVRAIELGADEFLGKPMSQPVAEALLERLQL